MSEFAINKPYFGPNDRRVSVIAADADHVTVRNPISFREEVWTLEEMRAFTAASKRRTYRDKDEVRVKIRADAESVVYLDDRLIEHRLTRAEWDKWRATIKG